MADYRPEDHWTSATDLMSGLMLLFLLIAISYMLHAQSRMDRMKAVAEHWAEQKEDIYHALEQEFADDLGGWQAQLERSTLIVRFREPRVLFATNSDSLTDMFKVILRDFFPRYLAVLSRFKESISEVRIEGHTSSEWRRGTPAEEAYYLNMKLSQDRTRQVLRYCLSCCKPSRDKEWMQKVLMAVGMSSSRIIRTSDGSEDRRASRRVEFRVRTRADEVLSTILFSDRDASEAGSSRRHQRE